MPAYKIASPEIIDLPLIEVVASRGKPLVISTGMASEVEIEEAVSTAQHAGASDIILLHCISAYPTQPKDSNLLVLPDLSKKLALPVGLSDHTIDITTSLAAVALGAVFIETKLLTQKKLTDFYIHCCIRFHKLSTLILKEPNNYVAN